MIISWTKRAFLMKYKAFFIVFEEPSFGEKCFVEFLFRFKTVVCSTLGGTFSVQVFHCFYYMEDWSYIESATMISDGCEEFVIHQPVTHSCIALKIESKMSLMKTYGTEHVTVYKRTISKLYILLLFLIV